MVHSRFEVASIAQGIWRWFLGKPANSHFFTGLKSPITCVIDSRESQGLTTKLGQLHEITDLDQFDALRSTSQLARAGILVIYPDLSDAFQSRIALSNDAREMLKRENADRAA